MIVEYHRPKRIEDALELISNSTIPAYPLAGGTRLNQFTSNRFNVVDLQGLGLDYLEFAGHSVSLGAMVTLQVLLDFILAQPKEFQDRMTGLVRAIRHEATYNLRQIATIGGTIVSGDGRSALNTMLLAADATLKIVSKENYTQGEIKKLGEFLPFRNIAPDGKLIISVSFPYNSFLAYKFIARTPADLPIVCVSTSIWSSGRIRVALGGFGTAPILAFDGDDLNGVVAASLNAYSMAEDEWASKDYRSEMAGILTRRCLQMDEN